MTLDSLDSSNYRELKTEMASGDSKASIPHDNNVTWNVEVEISSAREA